MIELCKTIQLPLVLIGGKEDSEQAENLISAFKNETEKYILNTCGKCTLNQSASLIKEATITDCP